MRHILVHTTPLSYTSIHPRLRAVQIARKKEELAVEVGKQNMLIEDLQHGKNYRFVNLVHFVMS